MKVNVGLEGVQAVVKNLSRAKALGEAGIVRGVTKAAEFLLAKSQELVPVDTGELKESGHVEVQGKTAAVVYDAPHALWVHERLDQHHEPPTQAKFLEQPAKEYVGEMRMIMSEEIMRDTDQTLGSIAVASKAASRKLTASDKDIAKGLTKHLRGL